MYFGCLIPLLLFLFGGLIISLALQGITKIGEIAVWLYDSALNLFRSQKKETVNPFTGESNFKADPVQEEDISYVQTMRREKIYADTDGTYIEYEELQ